MRPPGGGGTLRSISVVSITRSVPGIGNPSGWFLRISALLGVIFLKKYICSFQVACELPVGSNTLALYGNCLISNTLNEPHSSVREVVTRGIGMEMVS